MSDKSLQGFQVLPIKFSTSSSTSHQLFIKEHSVRGESKNRPKGRTLFVLNVPPWATKDSLKSGFNKFAPVANVIVQEKPSQNENLTVSDKYFQYQKTIDGFHVAYIIFQKPTHLLKVLNEGSTRTLILSNENQLISTGVQKWVKEYYKKVPNRDDLEKEINLFMKKFDQKEAKMKKNENKEQADEEGWITVTKRSRKPGLARKESVTNRIKNKDNISKKKKQLLNFYTFQIRESKMRHLANLREKFAEDKKKIEIMRNSRKFKPF